MPFETEALAFVGQCLENGEDLLSHDRQNFNIDTIKLIKTAPGTRLKGRKKKREEDTVRGIMRMCTD